MFRQLGDGLLCRLEFGLQCAVRDGQTECRWLGGACCLPGAVCVQIRGRRPLGSRAPL